MWYLDNKKLRESTVLYVTVYFILDCLDKEELCFNYCETKMFWQNNMWESTPLLSVIVWLRECLPKTSGTGMSCPLSSHDISVSPSTVKMDLTLGEMQSRKVNWHTSFSLRIMSGIVKRRDWNSLYGITSQDCLVTEILVTRIRPLPALIFGLCHFR